MLPKNTSGVSDIFPIRWDDTQRLGWGILVEFADGSYRTTFIGGKEQAAAAVMDELRELKFDERQIQTTRRSAAFIANIEPTCRAVIQRASRLLRTAYRSAGSRPSQIRREHLAD